MATLGYVPDFRMAMAPVDHAHSSTGKGIGPKVTLIRSVQALLDLDQDADRSNEQAGAQER
jgi:hypothetical protein